MTQNSPAAPAVKPLTGIRVLDLSRIIAGPLCGQYLADLGADVVKIERPVSGDDARDYVFPATWGDQSVMFMSFNRGKRSVVLDLAGADDRGAFLAFARSADVLIENFRPGVMDRLGLGYDALNAANPRLIYCSVSGFGNDGPQAQAGANDLVAQASCGLMALNASADGRPRKIAPAAVDLFTGANAVIAILAALRERDRTGRGAPVTTSLFECGVSMLSYFATGAFAERAGGRDSNMSAQASATITVPNQAFRCKDGWIVVACSNDAMWRRLAEGLGRPALATDARFATNAERTHNMSELIGMLDEIFAADTRGAWAERLSAAKVSVAAALTPEEAIDSPQAQSLGLVAPSRHAHIARFRMLATPFRIDGSRPVSEWAPPELGEHSDELLRSLTLPKEPS